MGNIKRKLVRDKIPEIIYMTTGRRANYINKRLIEEHYREKINEELEEFLENPCEEEAGDIAEIIIQMFRNYGFSLEEIVVAMYEKREKRGGFSDGVFLKMED